MSLGAEPSLAWGIGLAMFLPKLTFPTFEWELVPRVFPCFKVTSSGPSLGWEASCCLSEDSCQSSLCNSSFLTCFILCLAVTFQCPESLPDSTDTEVHNPSLVGLFFSQAQKPTFDTPWGESKLLFMNGWHAAAPLCSMKPKGLGEGKQRSCPGTDKGQQSCGGFHQPPLPPV